MARVSRTPVRVVCALIEKGRFILAARRRAGDSRGGLWEFPGGTVAVGESDREALMREIAEELGVKICMARRLKPSKKVYPDISIELVPFRCSIISGQPVAREHEEIRWVDRHAARWLEWAPADIPILDRWLDRAARAERRSTSGRPRRKRIHTA